MSDFSKFRSALNGFSRADVVKYIEETSLQHQKVLKQLEEENARLSEENGKLSQENGRLKEDLARLQREHEQLKKDDEALQEQLVTVSSEASELAEKAEAAQKELELANAKLPPKSEAEETPEIEEGPNSGEEALQSQELAAYRRAEQAERNAMLRARRLREQLNLLCEQSKDRYLDAGEELSALTSDLSASLSRLQETLADIQVIFDDAENAFDALQLPVEADEDE